MRNIVPLLLAAALWGIPSLASAQLDKKFLPPDIKKIHIGFRVFEQDSERTAAKVGLWTPVYVEVFGGTDGILPDPDKPPPYIQIDTVDSEDVGTFIRIPAVFVEPLKTRTFIGYVKAGRAGGSEIHFTLVVKGRKLPERKVENYSMLGIDSHLYLTLGSRINDLHRAVNKMNNGGNEKEEFDPRGTQFRNVVFENEVEKLPLMWFGYNSADLMILSTENRRFLTGLGNQPDRLKALADWVRRGGRLVIPIAKQNQDAVVALLENQAAWQPAIPVVPPRAPTDIKLLRLLAAENWGGVQGEPFQAEDKKDLLNKIPIPVATLDPGRVPAGDWEIMAEENGKPLIARVPYGLGQITYMAFSLEDAHFFAWAGKEQFLKRMVEKLASRAPEMRQQDFNRNMRFQQDFSDDLATGLLNGLDNFDVKTIPFGAVALFIVLYILVVGPLDFLLLKYVFKRLEWTWITFPTVVLAVSVIAYFAAYALKGRDMKINKIDIVDFDLRTSFRTDRDPNGQPRNVHAYGHSFFTILSPRIQNYTIGLEPNPAFWGAEPEPVALKGGGKIDKVLSADLLSWMGRPSGGMNDMGRPGGGTFFRNPYGFTEDASALVGVPIPVWTTKAFCASWEQTLPKSPFVVDLVYHQKFVGGKDLKITGKLENHLGVDLIDVWLIYDKHCYAIDSGLKSVKAGAAPAELSIAAHSAEEISPWVGRQGVADEVPRISADPTSKVKEILFHESFDIKNNVRNHLLRPLDLGWRLHSERIAPGDSRTREAILFGRVKFASGGAEGITEDRRHPVPTKLWLGDIPDTGKSRPSLSGQLNQDTYIRVLLPLRPSEQ